MAHVAGDGRVARLVALSTLTLGACIPGELTLEAGDSSTGTDGFFTFPDGSAESGSSSGGEAGPTNDSASPDVGADGEADAGAQDTGSPPGCACVDPLPSGWTFVAFDATSRDSCPTGYDTPTLLIVDPSNLGPSTCACSCAVTTPPSCTSGDFELAFGSGGSCTSGGNGFSGSDGACVTQSLAFAAADHMVTPAAAAGGSCTPSVTATPPSPGGGLGKLCTLSGTLAGGCGGGQVCAPSGLPLFDVCIGRTGQQACPSDFPNQFIVGTGITPGPCTSCTCASPTATCNNARLTVFGDGQCTTPIASVVADATCQAVSGGADAGGSYQYVADTANVACAPSQQPMPNGDSSLSGLMTVCCP